MGVAVGEGVGEGATAGSDVGVGGTGVAVGVGVGCAVLCTTLLCFPCRIGTGAAWVCPQGLITEASQIRPSAREPNMNKAITMGNTLRRKPPLIGCGFR